MNGSSQVERKETESHQGTESDEICHDIEVQKESDQTLIREIECLLAFLGVVFVAYLVHVINLVSKPPV